MLLSNKFIELPFCERNEIISKTFIKELHSFTNNKYDSAIKWLTKKTSSLFPLKDKIQHPSCKIYRSDCSCGEVYTGQLVKQTAMEQLEFRAGKMEW